MPNKLITLNRAKSEVDKLQKYIRLIENYEVHTLEDWIIKKYAINNSIINILEEGSKKEITYNSEPLNREYIVSVINGKAKNELHRIVRLGYRQKIRPNKRTLYRA